MSKIDTQVEVYGEDGSDHSLPTEKRGTDMDARDMQRVGKTQELRRNFRLLSILGFTAVLMCTWEAILLYVGPRSPAQTP